MKMNNLARHPNNLDSSVGHLHNLHSLVGNLNSSDNSIYGLFIKSSMTGNNVANCSVDDWQQRS